MPAACRRFEFVSSGGLRAQLTEATALIPPPGRVTDYLALEGVRFEDRLRVEFAIDPAAAQVAVPPMLLQTLVENALKHGIAPLPGGGELIIRATLQTDGMLVEVEDTGQIVTPGPGATQVGLANTRERLRILYGDGARIDLANRAGNRVTATVRIPRST